MSFLSMKPRRWRGAVALVTLLLAAQVADGGDPVQGDRLFRITRNKNDNIVCYDVRHVGGRLDLTAPVSVYWVIPSKGNRLENLNFIERTKAYGVRVLKSYGQDSADIQLAAGKRPIRVTRRGERWVALMTVEAAAVEVDSVYVMADESGPMPDVQWADLLGRFPFTGSPFRTRIAK